MRTIRLVMAILASLSTATAASAASCDDPFVGVWQLDLAQSQFTQGAGVTSKILIFSEVREGMLITETVVTGEGQTIVYRIPFRYDGRPVAQDATANYDALAVERTGPRTLRSTLTLKGTVVGKASQAISADGGSMEFVSELTLPSGEVARQTSLFRRL